MVTIINTDTGKDEHWYSGPESTYWTDGFGLSSFISKFDKTRLVWINRKTVPAATYTYFNFEVDELTVA